MFDRGCVLEFFVCRFRSLDFGRGFVFVGEIWVGSGDEIGILGKFC